MENNSPLEKGDKGEGEKSSEDHPHPRIEYGAGSNPPPSMGREVSTIPNLNQSQSVFVSLCMIVMNEEENIERALLSVRPVVDEMIVVDTGSTDSTKDIAAALGAKVYDFPWNDSFADARNYSLSKASGDWILVLDADEVISPLDYGKLRELVNRPAIANLSSFDRLRMTNTTQNLSNNSPLTKGDKGEGEVLSEDHPHPNPPPSMGREISALKIAYSFVTRTYVEQMNAAGWTANDGGYTNEETGTGWFPGEKVRLFPNDSRFRFEQALHERIEPSLINAEIKIKSCDIPVHHYGNFANKEKSAARSEKYYRIGKRKLADTGERNFMAFFEVAILGAELGKYDEALEYLRKTIELKPDFSRAWQSMGNAYYNLGNYKEALSSYKKAIGLRPEPRDIRHTLLMYATCELLTGNAEQAIAIAEDLLKNDISYPQAMLLLAEACLCKGAGRKGIKFLRILEDMRFDVGDALLKFAGMLLRTGNLQYAVSLLKGAVESDVATEEAKDLLEELRRK